MPVKLWEVLDKATVTRRARVADGDLFQKANPYDLLAAEMMARSEADAADYLVGTMRDYLLNMSATRRWEFLTAVRVAFGGTDFNALTTFLREHGLDLEYRAPKGGAAE